MASILENLNLSSDQSGSPEPGSHTEVDNESLLAEARRLFSLHEYLSCEKLVQQVLEREPNHPKAQVLLELTATKLAWQKLYKKMVPDKAPQDATLVADNHQAANPGAHYQENRERTIAALVRLLDHKHGFVRDRHGSPRPGEGAPDQDQRERNELNKDASHATEGARVRRLILSAMNFYQEGKIPEALCVAKGVLLLMPDHPQAKEIVDLLQQYLDDAMPKGREEKRTQHCHACGVSIDSGIDVIGISDQAVPGKELCGACKQKALSAHDTVTTSLPADSMRSTENLDSDSIPGRTITSEKTSGEAAKRRPGFKAKPAKLGVALFLMLVLGSGSAGFLAYRKFWQGHSSSVHPNHDLNGSLAEQLKSLAELALVPSPLDVAYTDKVPKIFLVTPLIPSRITAPQTGGRPKIQRPKESSQNVISVSEELETPRASSPSVIADLLHTAGIIDLRSDQLGPLHEVTGRLLNREGEVNKLPEPVLDPSVNEVNKAQSLQSQATIGTIHWSGQLGRDDVVLIAGRNSSSGSTQGELPGVPVMIEIKTRGIGIVEPPGPRNGWKHLVIRNGNRAQSAVTIGWTAIQ